MNLWRLVTYTKSLELYVERVESGHAYLKTFVTNSTDDLLSVFQALAFTVDAQILAVHKSISKDTIKTLVDVPQSCITLLGQISMFAIKDLLKQFKRLNQTMFQNLDDGVGIPCAHHIAEILECKSIIMPEDFHLQWYLRYTSECTIKGLIEINLDKPIRNLTISLSHETSSELKKIFDHINQIVAGTHKEELAKKRAAKGLRPQQKSKRVKKVEDVKDIPDLEQTKGDTDKGESSAYEPKEDLLDGIFTDSSDNEDSDGNKNEDRDEENNEEAAENEKPSNDEDQSTTKVQKEGGMIKEFLNNTQDTYISQLQHLLQPYIEGIFNPKGDGNCGFHCVAKALGYDNNGWSSVWHKMIKEITENKASYAKQQGGKQEAMMILEGLHVKTKKSKITLSEWLDKMAHGQWAPKNLQTPNVSA
ncbi:hypothetical protein H4Q26_006369 [Puccinia striiformis f. sp. tritici PST-130]|nr:hypothetical protein H4Q26_006369 [Puccinia striiformis f. sp. tritici PST-130]